jgi:hypothetical protein
MKTWANQSAAANRRHTGSQTAGLLELLRGDRELGADHALWTRGQRPRVQMAEPEESAEKLQLDGVHRRLGKLEAATGRHHRNAAAKVCSTTRAPACMISSTMNQPVPVVVRHARHSEEPGAGIPHAGICEGDAGQPAFLP